MNLVSNMARWWERTRTLFANRIEWVLFIVSLLMFNIWRIVAPCPVATEYTACENLQSTVFVICVGVFITLTAAYFAITKYSTLSHIWLALSINSLFEDFGFGNPSEFTIKEVMISLLIALYILLTRKKKPDVIE